ncbi:MAG TPA: D-alanyl-D-alanine carboxypeptidase/D-alanyl-D-alanine-endopeptidase [Chitinophagaceae bacterium]|nr:D-alanyl-D-alanine carboxypeptidase/D-alanyl-D-alanine-endopeptidase [Chitinophagaceae bacterium]
MKRFFLLVAGCWLLVTGSVGQTVAQKLQKAFAVFEKDPQLKHAISSLYVIDARTGQVVFNKNSQIGLAPASTQKIITSVTAFELLRKDYKYKTEFGVCIDYEKSVCLWINPSGDPTFGSWRWGTTGEKIIVDSLLNSLKKRNSKIEGIVLNAMGWNAEQIPDGWIWQDIGNYYGAGAGKLNWRENQYDLIMRSGKKVGDEVKLVKTEPKLYSYKLHSEVTSAAKGSGDNSFIYIPSTTPNAIVRGTIPVAEEGFTISGAIINPQNQFMETISDSIKRRFNWTLKEPFILDTTLLRTPSVFYTYYSPTLDSIIYWFNKKSVNLYGEALIKTFAYEKNGFGSTDSGVALVKKFWKEKGMDEDEINIVDGSGLSPLNRVTTHAQVEILKYAKSKDWFPHFFTSLPEYNGMKIKSGTIRGVKGFCGYHKAKNGKEYIFSFLVNNYNGSASTLVNKMYKVLDLLK